MNDAIKPFRLLGILIFSYCIVIIIGPGGSGDPGGPGGPAGPGGSGWSWNSEPKAQISGPTNPHTIVFPPPKVALTNFFILSDILLKEMFKGSLRV